MSGGYGGIGGGSRHAPAFGRIGFSSTFHTATLPPPPTETAPNGYGVQRYNRGFGYGDAAPVAAPTDSYYTQAGQLIGAYSSAADVRRALAKKEADLDALKKLRAKSPVLASVLDWQISRTDADIGALREKLMLTQEGESATRDWRSIGQTGGIVAIVAGVGVVALLGVGLAAAIKQARKSNPRKRRSRR